MRHMANVCFDALTIDLVKDVPPLKSSDVISPNFIVDSARGDREISAHRWYYTHHEHLPCLPADGKINNDRFPPSAVSRSGNFKVPFAENAVFIRE